MVWVVLLVVVSVLLAGRRSLDVLILRQPGTLYTTVGPDDVANFYNVQALNRTSRKTTFAIEVVKPEGASVTPLGPLNEIEPYGLLEGRLLLRLPRTALDGPSTAVTFRVRTTDGVVQTIESAFLGPATQAASGGHEPARSGGPR
jgi:hypothetical protein